MRKLLLFLSWGAALLLSAAPLAAQNSVDILGGGPQPTNTSGCAVNPNCIPAIWSTTSNAGSDITSAITTNFVFVPNSGHLVTDFPPDTPGKICLADTRDFAPVVFGQIAANCQASGGVAALIVFDGAINAPSAIPVFSISTANGDFLRNTVGYSPAPNYLSNYPIRTNPAPTISGPGPTGQHNCPSFQAAKAYVGPGTATYTPNESLCLPVGASRAGEPSMTVDSQGTIYVESMRGVPGGLDLWRWNQTADGGPNPDGTLPFKYEAQPDCGMFVTPFCTESGLAPGGGDGDVAVNAPDPSSLIPNLAVVSLSAAEITASNSTNHADTFSTPDVAASDVPVNDRMWIDGLDDPNHVYMEYHDFETTSQIFVQRSADGGQTYTDAFGAVVSPTLEASVGPPSGNIAGQIKVDRSGCSSHGNLYQIFVGPDNPTDNLQNSPNFFNAAYVGVATGVSLSSSTLSFTDYKIFSCGAGSTCPSGAGLGNLFPSLAVDNLGYVYAAWSDNNDIYYSYSNNQGTRWSPAIKVTQNTSQAGKSNVFPWIAADGNGHVAIAWYGADHTGNSNTVPLNTDWNVFVAETVNGHAMTPVFTLSQASDHANHQGQISTGGLLGSSDRSLLDFFQIAIDPTNHLVNIAYADNHAGSTIAYFTRQKTATSGISTGGKCAGTTHQAGGKGHAPGKNGGSAQFAFNEDDSSPQSNSASYSDPGSGVNFQATQFTSATFDEVAHSVTLVGSGTDNGLPVTFTILAVDSSLVAPGSFSITLTDGYSNSGSLLDGSITVF